MPSDAITLDITLYALPEDIIHHLMQPENYKGLQPFVASVDTLERGYTPQGHAFVHYCAVERVPLLAGLRLNTPLDIRTTVTQPGQQMVSLVQSSASVQVKFVYDFRRVGDATHLMLRVTVHASRWLAGFILARAHQAQTVVLSNLKQRLENASRV